MQRESRLIEFKRGSTVLVKDSVNQGYFYVVMEGTLALDVDRVLDDRKGRFNGGDTFGLVSAMTRRPHLSTITAETDAKVLKVPIENLGHYLSQQKGLALKMIKIYSRELRAWHRNLVGAQNDSQAGIVELLYDNSEIYQEKGKFALAARALRSFIDYVEKKPGSPAFSYLEDAKTKYEAIKESTKEGKQGEKRLFVVEADAPIFLENEPSDYFYVIKQGAVRISRLMDREDFVIDILGPGEIFGEMAILENKPRLATAIARSDCVLLQLPPATFLEDVGSVVLQKLFESLAKRIWIASMRELIRKVPENYGKVYCFLGILIMADKKANPRQKIVFNIDYQDLLGMVGLFSNVETSIPELYKDKNLQIGSGTIAINDPAVLMHAISQYDKSFRRFFDE